MEAPAVRLRNSRQTADDGGFAKIRCVALSVAWYQSAEACSEGAEASCEAHSEAAEAQHASETAELTEVQRAAEASTIVAGGKVLPSQRIDELCECCEIENRFPRQLNETMKCRQNVFAKAMDELR